MIKANELRIGNWIFDTRTVGDRIGLPKVQNPYQIKYNIQNHDYEYYDAIPITPEILERCGFERKGETDLIFKHNKEHLYIGINSPFDHCVLQIINQDPMTVINGIHFNTFNDVGKPFEYLHQLQNLYFALTGEELTVNF